MPDRIEIMLDYTQAPPSKKQLKAHFLDAQKHRHPHDMLSCAAYLILELEDRDKLLAIGLEYLVNQLSACRADAGFLTKTASAYRPTTIYYNTAHRPPAYSVTSFPNKAAVFQRAWGQASPVVCDNVSTSPLMEDARGIFTAIESQAVLFQQLRISRQTVGLACIDFSRDTHTWTVEETRLVNSFCTEFLGPLAAISHYWYGAMQDKPIRKPSRSELEAVRLAAKGMSYREIANARRKSNRTIENQLRNARANLGATNLAELVNKCEHWL